MKIYHPDLYRNPTAAPTGRSEWDYYVLRIMSKVGELADIPLPHDEKTKKVLAAVEAYAASHSGRDLGEGGFSKSRQSLLDNFINEVEKTSYIFPQKARLVFRTVCNFKTNQDSRILKVNSDFFRALGKVEVNLELDNLIPWDKVFYVSLPALVSFGSSVTVHKGKPIYLDKQDEIDGAYIYFHKEDGRAFCDILTTCTQDLNSHGGLSMAFCIPLLEKTLVGSIYEAMSNQRMADGTEGPLDEATKEKMSFVIKERSDFVNALANCAIYFNSYEPNVDHLAPERELRKNKDYKRKLMHSNEHRSEFSDVVLLNWSYGKDRVYSKDSTWVDSYLRYQPYGPGLRFRKLIMVKEHERHFTKNKNLTEIPDSDNKSN